MLPSTASSRIVSTRLRCGEGAGVSVARHGALPPVSGFARTSCRSRGSGIFVGFSSGGRNSSSRMAARAEPCFWIRRAISSAWEPSLLSNPGERARDYPPPPASSVGPHLRTPPKVLCIPAFGCSATSERGLCRGPLRP